MAINPNTQYPGKIATPDAFYPYGGAQNITVPGDNTGTPWEAALLNDIFGMQQALLKSGGIVPSGSPDKVSASQYLQAMIELASGRAITYDAGGTANAITLTARSNLEPIVSLFDGLFVRFTAISTNTGTMTINVAGTGVKNLRNQLSATMDAGMVVAGQDYEIRYDGIDYTLHDSLQKSGGVIARPQSHLSLKSITNTFSDLLARDSSDIIRGRLRYSLNTDTLTIDVRNNFGGVLGTLTLKNDGNITTSAAAPIAAADLTRKDWVESPARARGLVLLREQVISSSTTNIDFDTNIDSTYDKYILEYQNVVAVSSAVFGLRVKSGGTWQTGLVYRWGSTNYNDARIASNVSGTASLGGVNGQAVIYNPSNAAQRKLITVNSVHEDTTGAVINDGDTPFSYQSIAAVTGLRFYGVSANIASGTFRLYGLKK